MSDVLMSICDAPHCKSMVRADAAERWIPIAVWPVDGLKPDGSIRKYSIGEEWSAHGGEFAQSFKVCSPGCANAMIQRLMPRLFVLADKISLDEILVPVPPESTESVDDDQF